MAKESAGTPIRARASDLAALAAALMGLLVLIGWIGNMLIVTSLRPDWPSMKANTALAFLLLGIATYLTNDFIVRAKAIGVACAAVVVALGLLTLVEYLTGTDLRLDQLLAVDSAAVATAQPGRMSPITAVNFVLLGACLIFGSIRTKRFVRAVESLAILAMLLSYVAILAYIYDVTAMDLVWPYTSVALHTAIGFVVLAVGVLTGRDGGLFQSILGAGAGARIARRLLPFAVFAPALIGWLRLEAQRHGLFGTEFGIAVVVSAHVILFVAVILWNIAPLDASDEHKRAERKFRDLLESAPDAMIIMDKDGAITLVNARTERLFGHSRDALLGNPIDLLIPERILAIASLRSSNNGEQELLDSVADLELCGRHQDGHEFSIEVSLSPIRTEEGQLVCCAIRDVTNRRSVEATLAETEERFRGAFQAAAHGMALVSIDGHWLKVNASICRILGYDETELLSTDFQTLTHSDDLHADLDNVQQLLAGQIESYQMEKRYFHKDGHIVWVLLSVSLVRGADSEPVHFVSQVLDFTDRKRIEQTLRESNIELERASQTKDRFLASMSHELRTPLNGIIGFTGTLLMELPGPLNAAQKKQLEIVQTSARHLLGLINDILDVAKVESGNVDIKLEPVECRSIMAEIVSALRPSAESKGLALAEINPVGDLMFPTDRRLLSQVVINLVNNAIKFTNAGQVTLSLSRLEVGGRKALLVTVSDTGPGIRPEHQIRLFKAFSRIEEETRRDEGTGLGLYLSQKFADLLGGRISVSSEYGYGSVFKLELVEREVSGDIAHSHH